ncbi:MAG: filamentous hemagglutinin N-terminal domain-containing protein [Methylobacter sp.]|nr:filamentous hemagglutinin N-terminal domain-containing protein [Methylobacter sp.]MDP2099762.1 filamentous hemagglutinin N-terminal domain-containing protein [Methylobacter sp.]MDP2427946.1 filamentous hemagglutinin N-terminal domain-containing protein [Methylobacter sp.]MDP3055841.1 filamentous hemagglutinin N-terminal domain-containing protein [Methylobacter sp.]MDP3361668.1 filamentous hemagglutinin N-terminal domain-containing protein [Methylobacter sp.]
MSNRAKALCCPRILSYVLVAPFAPLNAAWADIGGGIVTDGSMGAAQTLIGDNLNIPQSLGTTVGNNLFHSFTEFNVATGQTVEFTGSNALKNVISRVTGTGATDIDGTLKSSIANAAFYFINPNGITFGANAQVDVPGSFHVSTADKIGFPDHGAVFYADSSQASTLSSEAPAAFGFLDTSAANNGLIEVNGAQLSVATGQTLDAVAGEIAVKNGATISAPAGEIRLVATQGISSVALTATDGNLPLPDVVPSPSNAGRISVTDANADTSGDGGGRIGLWGGQTLIEDSYIETGNTGTTDAASVQGIDIRSRVLTIDGSAVTSSASAIGNAGNVTLAATGDLTVVNGGTVGSGTAAQGDAGHVAVTASRLSIDGQGQSLAGIGSLSSADSSGHVGHVNINVGELAIVNGGIISSSTFGRGNAGNIAVVADTLSINSLGFSSGVTGIVTQAELGSSGHAGNLTVNAKMLGIVNGGSISSSTFTQGNAGNIGVVTDSLLIDGQLGEWAGITSAAGTDSGGHAGNVAIQAGTLDILNNGLISSDTLAQGNAGNITLQAGLINILSNGAISSSTLAQGQAGHVIITADTLNILSNGFISGSTLAQGNAGSIVISADTLTIDGLHEGAAGIASAANVGSSGHAGNVTVQARQLALRNNGLISSDTLALGNAGNVVIQAETLDILNNGLISSSTADQGDAGSVMVSAGALRIDGQAGLAGIASGAAAGSTGQAGNVVIRAGALDIVNGGKILSSTLAQGNAGSIAVSADTLNIDNFGFSSWVTGILSQAEQGSVGSAGSVSIQAGTLNVVNGGEIASSTFAHGNAGSVAVSADKMTVDNQGFSLWATGVLSQAEADSTGGHAGNVSIQAGALDIVNGGVIASSTFAQGNAGSVSVNAGALTIDGQTFLPSPTGVFSQAESGSGGHAGNLTVNAGILDIFNGGAISSSTFSQGNAGSVAITANTLTVDGRERDSAGIASAANAGSSGHAGHVTVQAGQLTLLNNGLISSDTLAQGNAGNVAIQAETLDILNNGFISSSTGAEGDAGSVIVSAGALTIDGQSGGAGIASGAAAGSTGHAGNVAVSARTLGVVNGGKILSSTLAQGKAGSVNVQAEQAVVSGGSSISSGSEGRDSSGRTGDVIVSVSDWLLLSEGRISIENEADAALNAALIRPGSIVVSATDIVMKDSEITSNASGNVAAGNITVNFSHQLTMAPSFISTTANTGDGGAIAINGGELIYLQNSGFRTTVSGANSNGGDIFTKAGILVMDSGLIQANAVGGSGGNIELGLDALIPSGNTLLLGGSAIAWQPLAPGFNVVQAASQAGLSGTVSVTAPQLNLSGIIANLGGAQFGSRSIGQDYCGSDNSSSLTRIGHGGLKPKSGEQLPF